MATMIEQVDEDFLKRWGYDKDGALYKLVQRLGETPNGNDYSNSPAFGDTLYGIEKKTREWEDWSDLNAFVAGLNSGTSDAKKAHLFRTMNLPNLVNFLALRALVSEIDVNRKNFYFYRDTTGSGEWYLFPWDKDMTLGVGYSTSVPTNLNNPWQATNVYKHDPSSTKQWNVLWEQAYQAPELRAMVGRRLRTLMDEMMGASGTIPGNTLMEQRVEAVRAQMTPLPTGVTVSGYRDRSGFDSWLGQHRTALFTTYGPSSAYGMIPGAAAASPAITISTADPNPATGTQDHEYLLLVNSNADSVDLTGWTLAGGGLNHTFKAGTIIPGTAVSSTLNRAYVVNKRAEFRTRPGAPTSAELVLGNYDGQLSARGGTVVLSRKDGSVAATYVLPVAPTAGQQQLRISKIMYAPTPPAASELAALPTVEAGDFEYIELHNIGATTLNLAGYRFTDGITFTVPSGVTLAAGARLIVAGNPAAFDLRYGAGLNRVGPFTGALDNSGERLRIVDALGEEILDFTYSPAWYPASDEGGYALCVGNDLATSYADWGLPEKWALSGSVGGAPGQAPTYFSQQYAGWKNGVFTAAERGNPAVSGSAVTLNGAGISNALAFALNLNPRAPDFAAMPGPVVVTDAGQTYAALRFRRWKNGLGVTYTVEGSTDLASWGAISTQVSATPNGDDTETVTVRGTTPGTSPRFLRLRVTVTP
jgi:hypothetical protein